MMYPTFANSARLSRIHTEPARSFHPNITTTSLDFSKLYWDPHGRGYLGYREKTITFRAKLVVVRSNSDPSCWVCFARALVCLVLALSRCAPSIAQTVYGSIVGQVLDSSGAVVKDASVSAIDLGTSESRSDTTKREGDYQFVNLLPGRYRI
jgi:hypothetical protein